MTTRPTGTSTGWHYSDVIMSAMASQITGVSIVLSTVCSSADKRKCQSSVSLAFVRGIHRWPVNSPHKGPVTRKMFSFDDVIVTVTHVMIPIGAQTISRHHASLSMTSVLSILTHWSLMKHMRQWTGPEWVKWGPTVCSTLRYYPNLPWLLISRLVSQTPQYIIRQISLDAPFCNRNVHTYEHFCYQMVHCGIWDWCIVGFVQQVCQSIRNKFS